MAKVCLYHGGDMDGICSAAIVKHRYPDVKLISMQYDDTINLYELFDEGDEVYVVDFTLQPFGLMDIANKRCDLTWIDHHSTSIIDYFNYKKSKRIGEVKGIRETNQSACELTWNYLFPDKELPYPVWLLGRYDIWQHHESKSILPFEFGMKLNYHIPESSSWWAQIFNADRDDAIIQDIIRDGKTIIKYRDKLNEKLCEVQAFESKIKNYRCICINRALCGSTVFNSLWDPEKYDIMVTFYVCKKGFWNVSLYTEKDNDINVGKIAKEYGGGGHAGAAGFRCSILPFEIK